MLDSTWLAFADRAAAIPAVYGLIALLAARTCPPETAWRALRIGALATLLVAAAGAASPIAGRVLGFGLPELSADPVTLTILLLVTFIGFIIAVYSRRYLDGDADQVGYVRWLMATLCAVTTLVVTSSLLVMAVAWIATSLALHHLLMHFRDRPQAIIAAHKKFLVSRLADVCLLIAVFCVGQSFGTLQLDALAAAMGGPLPDTPLVTVAAVLFALTAVIKCAQLPFHGWLIQVMEAPTPVSALLHAGVVNIGGIVMIRLAPLVSQIEAAQLILVAAGTVTVLLAGLVMTTRVSIKVNLAWSTCAQMGFMLMQCGLGAYSLALLHIVAHSLYKAYAFLSSGSAVDAWRVKVLSPTAPTSGPGQRLLGLLLWIAVVAAVAAAVDVGTGPALWLFVGVLAVSLLPVVTGGWRGPRGFAGVMATVGGIAGLYWLWHGLFIDLLPAAGTPPSAARLWIAATGFALLFALTTVLARAPSGRLARALHPHLFAGFYLDEIFTRLTFRIWPARKLPNPASAATSKTLNEV